MAKGQKRSGREPKKPKKTAAERLKSSQSPANLQAARMADKESPKK